jgi:hypothetical protein
VARCRRLPNRPCLAGYGNTLKFGIVTPEDGGGGGEEVEEQQSSNGKITGRTSQSQGSCHQITHGNGNNGASLP